MTRTQIETTKWTAQEFERQVFDCNPKVVVFDGDGTLWSNDSGVGFMVWSIEQGLVSRSAADWIDTRYRAYLAGAVGEEAICGEMVQIYAGLCEQELRASAARYVREFIQPCVFAEMASLAARLLSNGVELWAVSSTNKWVVTEDVRAFGIPEERVLAAEVRVTDGLITSEILDVPTGPSKAAALARVGLSRPDAVFGNSIHDLAMLEIARHAFPVNPSTKLMEAAAEKGWGYFQPEAVRDVEEGLIGQSSGFGLLK